MKLKISEIFISIQGESSWTGYPFFFIRTSGCNLNCSYCDTKYAKKFGKFISIKDIVDKAILSKIKKILITGGEPLIQENIYLLIDMLLENNFEVFIETNGSILIDKLPRSVIKILDFKTPSSGECEKNNFKNIDFLQEKDEVKFVIGDFNDYNWAIEIVEKFKLYNILKNILFSPVSGKLDAKILGDWIINDKLNWARLQIQLHKIIGMR